MSSLQSRRNFIRQSSVAALSLGTVPSLLANPQKMFDHISLQLYSVREDMKIDPVATLKQVAAIGYKEVEPANYVDGKCYGKTPAEFRKLCQGLGMTISSSHVLFSKNDWNASTKDISDRYKKAIADAVTMGQTFLINPGIDSDKKNLDEVKRMLDSWNVCGERCKAAGLQFGFHNHYDEFTIQHEGKLLYEIFLERLDPKLVIQQLDTCNMKIARANAIEWIKKYPKHIRMLHIKDKAKDRDESTYLGNGEIDWPPLLAAAKKAGIKYYVVEQESYDGNQPLDSVEMDYVRMKLWNG